MWSAQRRHAAARRSVNDPCKGRGQLVALLLRRSAPDDRCAVCVHASHGFDAVWTRPPSVDPIRIRFDTVRVVKHPRRVVGSLYRVVAIALSLLLSGGNGVVCAGWAPTPEARMACCADDNCPMHRGGSDESSSQRTVTQAQADACCAASEREQSSSSTPTAVAIISAAVLGAGVDLPAVTPSLVLTDGWRMDAPIHSPPVPRHVLLSVFLV